MSTTVKSDESGISDPIGADDLSSRRRRPLIPTAPVMGRLADGSRQRTVILVALSAVVVGCVVSAVSSGFTVLILGRALQGVGLGLLPVAMAIARPNLASDSARQTIATLSVSTAIGAGLGYPVTGLIAQVLNLRAAYWFGVITVAGALVLAALVLPPRSAAPRGASTSWVPFCSAWRSSGFQSC
jgi:predicted MFS family arabinose efflux permease